MNLPCFPGAGNLSPDRHDSTVCDSPPTPFTRAESEKLHPEMAQNYLYHENTQYNGDEPHSIHPVEQVQAIEQSRHQYALHDVVGQRHLPHRLQQFRHCFELLYNEGEECDIAE